MSRRLQWLVVLGLALLVGFAFQGSRGLYETTEGRYAESAREMLASGNYMEPTLAGRPHWTKPPPVYWSIAAGLRLAGTNAWGARLANGAAFVATALLVAALATALWDARTGRVAALVYATSLLPATAANVLSADTLLTLAETGAMLAFVLAWRTADASRSCWWMRAMWAAFGVAFFVKGPPALLPLLAVVALRRIAPRRVPSVFDAWGILLLVVAGGWWYALEAARHPGLLGYFVGDEVVGRVLTDQHHRNPEWYKPFVIYLPVLLLGPGAWLALVMPEFRRMRLHPARTWIARVRSGGPGALLALWLLLPLLVFSLSRSRLPLYVLPLYVPIALGIARVVTAALPPSGHLIPRRVWRLALLSAVVLVTAKGAAARLHGRADMTALAGEVRARLGPDASVWLVGDERLYGLYFHLDGRVRRAGSDADDPPADASLVSVLAGGMNLPGMDLPGTSDPAVRRNLIAAGAWSDSLERALARSAVTWRRVPLAGRDLFVVTPMVAAARGRSVPGGAASREAGAGG